MNNGDVLWAWVAGILVVLATLTVLPRTSGLTDSVAQNGDMSRSEVAIGAGRRNLDWWERVNGTPRRTRTEKALFDGLDHLERIAPETELPDAEPAVAEDPPKP